MPGMAIGIVAGGEAMTGGLGVTDPRAPLGVDADTLFQIGSISKTFAATLAALLAQRGRLDLDAPLTEYLPEFQVADADATKRATPRVLLSHNAGWLGDHFEMENPSLELAVARMRWMPQLYPLGDLWSYNNAAFYVAGRLLEVGEDRARALRDWLARRAVLAYCYGDWMERHGGLEGLLRQAGLPAPSRSVVRGENAEAVVL